MQRRLPLLLRHDEFLTVSDIHTGTSSPYPAATEVIDAAVGMSGVDWLSYLTDACDYSCGNFCHVHAIAQEVTADVVGLIVAYLLMNGLHEVVVVAHQIGELVGAGVPGGENLDAFQLGLVREDDFLTPVTQEVTVWVQLP